MEEAPVALAAAPAPPLAVAESPAAAPEYFPAAEEEPLDEPTPSEPAEEPLDEEPTPEEPAAADANLSALETYLRQVFDRVDTGGDGEISVVEAIKALRTDDEFAELLGFEEATRVKASDGSKDRLTLALAALDSDGDKCVSWEEFRRAALGDVEEADAPSSSWSRATRRRGAAGSR